MDKRLIKPLEGWMAIPEIVNVLCLSRARVHQLIEEDKFDIDDMRVVGDKRMVLIKNAAVYKQLQYQEERAARIAADKAAEEQRIMGRMAAGEAHKAMLRESRPSLAAESIPAASALDFEESMV
jgi:hypothetical protein